MARRRVSGAAMLDGREFDGIFDTEDCRHIVEATTSRRKDNAEDDLKKLAAFVKRHGSRARTLAVRGWFVTAEEPTADQRQVANKYRDTINIYLSRNFSRDWWIHVAT